MLLLDIATLWSFAILLAYGAGRLFMSANARRWPEPDAIRTVRTTVEELRPAARR
jgi:hypothetical protein